MLKLAICLLFGTLLASDVKVLGDKTLAQAIKDNKRILVEFYAPWCGHCKALEPEYEKAAEQLKADGVETVLAKVDATVEKAVAAEYGVRGFPTIKYFDTTNPMDYTGGRTSETIVDWLTKRSLPALSSLEDKDAVDALTQKGKLVVVGFFKEGSDEAKALADFANEERDTYTFGLVTSEATAVACEAQMGTANLYREMAVDEAKRTFETTTVSMKAGGDVKEFVKEEGFPLLDVIGPDNYQLYMKRGLPIAWLALDPSASDVEETKNIAKENAKKLKGKVSFVFVDAVQYEGHVQNLGITKTPGMMINGGGEDKKKFLLEEDFNAETAGAFFTSFADGTLKAFLKSAAEPTAEEQDAEKVFIAVGSTFEALVKGPKAVLVEFYAPWCGHCKKLAPDYEKAAKHFESNDNVVLAKMDATENDSFEDVQGFPTLVWYPADYPTASKEKYGGARNADGIIEWVTEKIGTGEKSEL